MRIAATADLHFRTTEDSSLTALFEDIQQNADILVVAGDLTDNGLLPEAEMVAKALKSLSIPVVAVLGNHDHEGGKPEEIASLLKNEGIYLLEGTTIEFDGVGFAGTKGFCGGFDNLFIQPFGESALKNFINNSIEEAVILENALTKLNCKQRVVVLHYSPISSTLKGEALELYPFLGTSRLANAVDRQGADMILHGHAHHGTHRGETPANIPVYNVCRFVLNQAGGKSYCVIDI